MEMLALKLVSKIKRFHKKDLNMQFHSPERLAMELVVLIAILHGNVGSEVGK